MRYRSALVSALVLAALCASCSSSSSSHATATTEATPAGSAAAQQPATTLPLGKGVSATSIRVGVGLVDFTCIEQYTNSIRTNQQQQWGAYFDDINQHGGVLGRQLVPVYESYCPIGNTGALNLCTKFTEDDNVFAVVGDFIDFSGDAETCVARDHSTVLLTFELTRAIIDESPPGMIVMPGSVPERRDSVLFQLLESQHTLDGKTVGVLGETTSATTVNSSVVPGLKNLGVQVGSTAILTITNADTSAAQSQLDSFIEKWKTEHVDTIFISGPQVSSQQFMEKLRSGLPDVTLITDATATDVLGYGQQEQKSGRHPNPYEGMITIGGPTSKEYDDSSNWQYCAQIYQQQTGMVAPNAETVVPGPNGKTLDINGSLNDACQTVTMFRDIATRAGKDLDNQSWVKAVDTYGPIRNMGGGQYASLHTGKYDVDDTFRLEEFNSSLAPNGQWQPITPLENVPGV